MRDVSDKMAAKRDRVAEIFERRSRNYRRIPRMERIRRRFSSLYRTFYSLQRRPSPVPAECKKELYRHFPVALVALLEGYIKEIVAELVDSSPIHRSRLAKWKPISIDLNLATSLWTKDITLGELVSAQITISSRSDVEQLLSVVLDEQFEHVFEDRLFKEDQGLGEDIFKKRLRGMIDGVFKERHALCHELAPRGVSKRSHVETFIKGFHVYIVLLEEHITESKPGR